MSKGTCKAEGCEKEAVGKGYCRRHYRAWKRGRMPKPRYKTCAEEGCRKPQVSGARCEEHRRDKPPSPPAEAGGGENAAAAEGAPAEA